VETTTNSSAASDTVFRTDSGRGKLAQTTTFGCYVRQLTSLPGFHLLSHRYVVAQIKDNDIGIEDLERIFESFFTSKRNGMGLGLAISRSIVETNEGRLWVESTVGTGSTFYFTVPVDSSFAE